jgi:5,10-methylenetetrahydromethanopterin reductase
MEIGALDELAGGRAALGIGSGVGTAIEAIGFASDRPIAAVRDAFAIVRRLLGGEAVTYEGEIFSAKGVKLGYRPLRSAMPLFMAARGDQSLRLCGRIADGLMISNMCSPGFTRYAVGLVRDAARAAGRASPAEVVQYVPCAVAASRDEAYVGAKEALGRMLPGFWSLGQRLPAAKAALLRDSGIGEGEFAAAVRRLRAGEPAVRAVDDRFVTAFAVAGTVEDCLTQSARYAEAGVTELVLTFVGNVPTDDIAELGVRLRDGVA